MLGNAIVPGAARLAFFRMYTEFEISSAKDLYARTGTAIAYVPGTSRGVRRAMPYSTSHGSTETRKSVYAYADPKEDPPRKDWRIVLDPNHYKDVQSTYRDRRHAPEAQSPALTRPVHRTQWATPRTPNGTGHVLTERMAGDIQTMARFASSVDGVKQPRTDSTKYVNIRYIEWVMGLPKDHTEYP
jgi:hypothetical protein